MVKDKINYRSLGPRTALTRQAVSGRANDGGLRIGEMERDTIISHGATDFLRESMMERGDKFKMAVCNTSGMIAIYNPSKNVFISPMADGPIKFVGSVDNNSMHIENVTQFGRNFSVIEVPYSMKLLMHELMSINISMRIITEDNIEQLENMSFSNNIDLLLQEKNVDPKMIVQKIRNKLQKAVNMDTPQSINLPQTPEDSPGYNPLTPEDSPSYHPIKPDSVEYQLNTPDFTPQSPNTPPGFIPQSPNTPPPASDSPNVKYYPLDVDSMSPNNSTIPAPPPGSPSPNEMQGGSQGFDFKEEELVFYRGDHKPSRAWQIKKIGDKFITIHTEDNEGLDSIDTTKIVQPNDIYPLKNYPYSSPFSESFAQNMGTNPQEMNKIKTDQPTININVAPVFKNQSKEEEVSNPDYIPSGDDMVMPGIKISNSTSKQPEPEKPNNDIFNGGLIIKKT
tara:strand:+ start:22 stop:1374 length:1353 start_codon:yes stop_codon:yes gene_type:complete